VWEPPRNAGKKKGKKGKKISIYGKKGTMVYMEYFGTKMKSLFKFIQRQPVAHFLLSG
jgi:hypothetical protein